MKKEFDKAYKERQDFVEVLKEAGESDKTINLITKFYFRPVQSLETRYEYVKRARYEKHLDIFEKIAALFAEHYSYTIQSETDKYLALMYLVNDAYDFDFILTLSRYFNEKRYLFDWHFDVMKNMLKVGRLSDWHAAKEFLLSTTVNR